MTSPKLSADTPRGRMYRLEPDGPLMYPSITTVAGMRSKEFLQGWYATMAAKRALDMFAFLERNPQRAPAEITRVMRNQRSTQQAIAGAAGEYSQTRADFGTLVHAACEAWAEQNERPSAAAVEQMATTMAQESGAFAKEPSLQDLVGKVQQRLDGYGAFLDQYQPEFLEVEQTVVNHHVKYAGTTDAIVRIGGSVLSADIKTSTKVRGEYALQGVAVERAEKLLDADGTERDMPPVAGAFIVHLPEGGGFSVVPLKTTNKEFEVFCALRQIWDFNDDACALDPAASPQQLLVSLLTAKDGVGLLG